MKKLIIPAIIAVLCMFVLAGCGCEHEWAEATCTDPKTCTLCSTTDGTPAGHVWNEANCTEPKTCSVCGASEGETLGHSWVEATETEPKTCTVCALTEGEPLFNPAYAKDAVRATEAYSSLNKYVGFLYGKDRSIKYYEDERVVYFDLVLTDGAFEAYAGRGDNWGLYTTYIKMASVEGTLAFAEEGLDIKFHIRVYDDRDGTTIIYEAENGNVITDYYADIVPAFLKTRSFESAFFTVYHNFDDNYEITAEYDANGLLYFFIRLDSATSLLFNSLSISEVQQHNIWKTLTETTTRWSVQFTQDFTAEGHEVLCVFMLIDGNSVEDAFYCVANGTVIYDYFA